MTELEQMVEAVAAELLQRYSGTGCELASGAMFGAAESLLYLLDSKALTDRTDDGKLEAA